MSTANYKKLDCPIAESLSVLGDQWTLLIIRDALMGVSSFSEFERRLGISKRLLSRRLTELVDHELLRRVPTKEGSTRMKYTPTHKARELAVVLSAFIVWGEKWYPGAGGERYTIQESETGEKVVPGMVVQRTNCVVALADCAFLPGPGYSAVPRA